MSHEQQVPVYSFLEQIRRREIEQALTFFPEQGRVLEIGSGSGWQAKKIQEHGYEVVGLEIEGSPYLKEAVFPITLYDGKHLPFPDGAFDIVFSSNVQEHIPHVEAFQQEIRRVLKPGGVAIHILPTSVWRFWSNLTHYIWLVRLIASRLQRSNTPSQPTPTPDSQAKPAPPKQSRLQKLVKELLPLRHGEFGNFLSEIYYFSSSRWMPLFRRAGFHIIATDVNHLFYTGYNICDAKLAFSSRTHLSRLFGSACRIYVMQKPMHQQDSDR